MRRLRDPLPLRVSHLPRTFITSILQELYEGVRQASGVENVHAGEVDELVELGNQVCDGLSTFWAENGFLDLIGFMVPFKVEILKTYFY